jgi:hypothetical protein
VTTMQNDMRDRLINLLLNRPMLADSVELANYLIANGVVLPICKIDDKVFYYAEWEKIVYCENVNKIFTETSQNGETIFRYETETLEFTNEDIGFNIFLTKEQAEQKLNEMRVENGNL